MEISRKGQALFEIEFGVLPYVPAHQSRSLLRVARLLAHAAARRIGVAWIGTINRLS
jgi:hypothetical protein